MSTTTVTGLNVLAVYVTDLQRSETFYREQLGFGESQEMSPGILMSVGDVTLYLEANRQTENPAQSEACELTPCFAPCFATESVKSSYEALKAAGVKIAADYKEFSPEFAMFQIADPDGNLIEFAGTP